MQRLTPDMIMHLYEEALKGRTSTIEEGAEFFGNDYLSHWMNGFTVPAYWPMYFFLFMVARRLEPEFVLELGVEVGRGMASMHLGYPHAPIVGVDINDINGPHNMVDAIAMPGKHRFIIGDSTELHNQAPQQTIGLMQIDTSHTYDQTLKEYDTYRSHMRAGGIICMDDIFLPGVNQVWQERIEGPPYNTKIELGGLHEGAGYGCCLCDMGKGQNEA